jgi:hypothetical protein
MVSSALGCSYYTLSSPLHSRLYLQPRGLSREVVCTNSSENATLFVGSEMMGGRMERKNESKILL